jgi:class 3 adenylate cyclase
MNPNLLHKQSSILRKNQNQDGQAKRKEKRTSFSCGEGTPAKPHHATRNFSGVSRESDSLNTSLATAREKHPFSLWRVVRPRLSMSNSRKSSIDSTSTLQPPWFTPSETTVKAYKVIVRSAVWNALVFICTLVLLFGGPIQQYFRHKAKIYFNPAYIITIVILFVDMFLTSQTEKGYFKCYWNSWSDFALGGFIFNFDFLSVMTLFASISYINPIHTSPMRISIQVLNGVPLDISATIGSFNVDWMIIVGVIVRITRIARFLDISRVLKFSTKMSDLFYTLTDRKYYKMPTLECLIRCGKSRRKSPHLVRDNSAKISEDSFVGRHIVAAIKIQEAWRKHFYHDDNQKHIADKAINRKQKDRLARLQRHYKQSSIPKIANPANTKSSSGKRRKKRAAKASQIGLAMNVITTKRVAYGIVLAMVLTSTFSPHETDLTMEITMVTLHDSFTKTSSQAYEKDDRSIFDIGAPMFADTAFNSSTSNMLSLTYFDGSGSYNFETNFTSFDFNNIDETLTIKVSDNFNSTTTGIFQEFGAQRRKGTVALLLLLFEALAWSFGLLLFAAPVTTLVVKPIERMIRLLSMLVRDPLGFDSTERYKKFVSEEEELATHTPWTTDNLKGMETSFLMSTILRIGSLMKVGFGAAGVQIIRGSLRKNSGCNIMMRNHQQATTVSCIFLFCDIRQFTDASECLQEEVFLFTNKIAEVIHSICHSLSGFANKNIGDAFLLNWKLEESSDKHSLIADKKQADKALLSVVQISIALCSEQFFLEDISEDAQERLNSKFYDRPGNIVQLGFGLHAGKAVEGAIGSPRKLDATYLSNEVELAEFLESSTKKYGTSVLMSGTFFRLLHPSNQRRCRQIDEAFFEQEYGDFADEELVDIPEEESESFMRLYTFDIDVGAIHTLNQDAMNRSAHEQSTRSAIQGSIDDTNASVRKSLFRSSTSSRSSRHFTFQRLNHRTYRQSHGDLRESSVNSEISNEVAFSLEKKAFALPSGKINYHSSLWMDENIKALRQNFPPTFFQKFKVGFNAYLEGDWSTAKTNFDFMVSIFDDQPSKELLRKMANTNFLPPRNFRYRLGVS